MKLSELSESKRSKKKKYNVETPGVPGFIKPEEELAAAAYRSSITPDTSSVPAVDPYNSSPRPIDKPGSSGSSRVVRARKVEGF